MPKSNSKIGNPFGQFLRAAREQSGLTQHELARQCQITRTQIVKFELNLAVPKWNEVVRLAGALGKPLQYFLTGQRRPRTGLAEVGFELHAYGLRDMVLDPSAVPGAFRRLEEVLVLAVRGDDPDIRTIQGLPYILSRYTINTSLIIAFSSIYDARAKVRLAWLASVTNHLRRQNLFPQQDDNTANLERLCRLVKKPVDIDFLGYPSTRDVPPIWKRWNIGFGGTLTEFTERIVELSSRAKPTEESE